MTDCDRLNAFVAENLRLLYKFMMRYQVDEEHFSRLAIRFIRTAERYLSESELQKYEFSTIVWFHMRSELYEIYRKERTWAPPVLLEDLDAIPEDGRDSDYGMLSDLLEKVLTDRQLRSLTRRLEGYTNTEIALQDDVTVNSVEKRFIRIRKKLKKLLEELK